VVVTTRFPVILLLVALAAWPGLAQGQAADAALPVPPVPHHDPKALGVEGSIVPWALLADVTVTSESHGLFKTVFSVERNPAVHALDGTTVQIAGFLFPLEAAERHGHFLLTAYPPSCPYCLPAGPDLMVEVNAAEPVAYTDAAIVMAGRFEVLEDDPSGMSYALHDARRVGHR
jgi:hypothetical protein